MEENSPENKLAALMGLSIPNCSGPNVTDDTLDRMIALRDQIEVEMQKRLDQKEPDPDFTPDELSEMKANLKRAQTDLNLASKYRADTRRDRWITFGFAALGCVLPALSRFVFFSFCIYTWKSWGWL